jgi:tetratricopeptide (TPR) repeat protein
LSGALCAGAALIYLKFDSTRDRRAYVIAVALFLAGVMTKTIIITLPAVLLSIFWWKRARLSWKRDIQPLIPLFVVGVAAAIVTVWVEQKFCTENGETFHYSWLDRVLIAGRLFWFYIGELFWPKNLVLIYSAWKIDQGIWSQYLYPLAALVLFVGLWLFRKKSRGPFAAAFAFLVMLSPVLGFFNLSYFMSAVGGDDHAAIFRADHFQYLAAVPIFAIVSAAITWLARLKINFRPAIYTGCGILLVLLATLTFAHSIAFRDSETCFRDVIAKNPDSVTARSNLGNLLLQKGAVDEAIAQFRRSVQIDPGYQYGRYNLGAALLQKGETDESISQLRQVLYVDPNHSRAYYTLANALAKKGETNEAIAYFGRALKLTPDFPDAHCNLANLLLEKGDIDNALVHYREALRLQPNDPGAHYNLAVGLVRKGDLEPAIGELKITLQIDPNYPDAGPLLQQLLAQKPQ